MSLRLVSPIKAFADGIVAVAIAVVLMFGLANTPRAVAADERLQFTATTLSGAPFDGASLQGKPAVLWFWTPWCPFCNAEAPSLSQVAAANPAVTFVGIATRADVGAMQSFVSKYNLNFTNLNDADGVIWPATTCLGNRHLCSIARTAHRRSSTTPPRPCLRTSCPAGWLR